MTIIKIPVQVEVSPDNGTALTLNAETRVITDAQGNTWNAEELAANVVSRSLHEWLDTSYPVGD